MKRVPSIFIIITFVIFSNVHLNSQIFLPAEYTDSYGVSYSGRVNINQLKNKESIKFYTEGNTLIVLTPSNTKEIIIQNYGHFVSGIVETRFVEVLVEGAANLYIYDEIMRISKNGQNYELEKKSNKWSGILKVIVSDCQGQNLYKEKDLKFTEEHITNIIKNYNECKNQLYASKVIRIKKSEHSFGPQIGCILSIMNFPKDYKLPGIKYKFGTPISFTPIFGVKFNTYSFGRNQKHNFEISPFLTFEKYNSEITYLDANHSNYIKSKIKSTSIFLPLIWNYKYFDNSDRKMLINGGFGCKINQNTSYTVDYEETHLIAGQRRYYSEDRLSDLRGLQVFIVFGHNFVLSGIGKDNLNIGLNCFIISTHTEITVKNLVSSIQLNVSYEFGI